MSDTEKPVVFLNRTAILNAMDTEYRDVAVPQWGGTVRVRSISAAERERLMKISVVTEGKGKNAVQRFHMPTFRVKLAALAMVDIEGNRLFSEEDVFALGRKNARAMELVSDVALDLANVQDDTKDADEGDADDDAGKGDSATTPNGDDATSYASRLEA